MPSRKPRAKPADPCRVLSIRQPYAWLIAHGYKREEYRNWSTNYRGPLLIHASLTKTDTEVDFYREFKRQARDMPPFDDLERGGIVGVCEVVDCTSRYDYYAWQLTKARPITFVKEKGKLSLARVTDPKLLKLVDPKLAAAAATASSTETEAPPKRKRKAKAAASSSAVPAMPTSETARKTRGLWRYGRGR